MASWVVLEAPPGASVRKGEELVFLRDGFSWLAFLFPPLWLLWHRLWIEAVAVFAVLFAASTLERVGWLAMAVPFLSLLVSIFIGLEGNTMRIAARQRRGWRVATLIEAGSEDDAETRYAVGEDDDEERPADRQPIVPSPTPAGTPHAAPVGLLLNPGR
jgi:uncharacterized protein DUF2628